MLHVGWIAGAMIRNAIAGMVLAAALMMSVQLPPVLAEDSGGSNSPETQQPPTTTPAKPDDSQDTAKERDDKTEGFDRYGPGCPYDGRELEPLLVGSAIASPICPRQLDQLI